MTCTNQLPIQQRLAEQIECAMDDYDRRMDAADQYMQAKAMQETVHARWRGVRRQKDFVDKVQGSDVGDESMAKARVAYHAAVEIVEVLHGRHAQAVYLAATSRAETKELWHDYWDAAENDSIRTFDQFWTEVQAEHRADELDEWLEQMAFVDDEEVAS